MNKRVLSLLIAFASFASIAAAQPYSCTAFTGTQPIRSEGVAEYIADIVVVCNGGDGDSDIPSQSVTVTLNANITSRTDPSTFTPGNSEATLLIDDAPPNSRFPGSNIFRAFQSSANSVTFDPVLVFQPGGGPRTYRFSNIRIDASQLAPGTAILAQVTTTGPVTLPGTFVTAGTVQPRQGIDIRTCDDSQTTFVNFLQSASQNPGLASGTSLFGNVQFNVRFSGNFQGAFRRQIAPTQNPWIPGIQYNSESNFVDTAVLGPNAGVATQGTRLMSRFNNIPFGVRIFVTTQPLGPGGASSSTLSASLISADADGAGPSTPVSGTATTGSCATSGASQPIAELPITNGSAQAVWEVTNSSTTTPEKASFGVVVAYVSNFTTAVSPGLGTATVTGRLGPVSPSASTAPPATWPRFSANAPNLPAFAIGAAAGNPFTITTASPLPPGQLGVVYSLPSFAASGGTPSFNWSVPPGSTLPPGLTLAPGGTFGGTPTSPGTYSFAIQVTDQAGLIAVKAFVITIATSSGPTITTASPLPPGTVGAVYTPVQFQATGLSLPVTWSFFSAPLPPGMSLSSAGVLSGTPTTQGTFNFLVRAANSFQQQATKQFTITINPVSTTVITISPSTLPTGVTGTAYSQTLTAIGGIGPYTFTVGTGSLPSGLTLSPGGLLSGTLLAPGVSLFSLVATDSQSHSGTQAYGVPVILNTPPGTGVTGISITTKFLPNGAVGTDYTPSLAATGGVLPITWFADPQSLPPGVSLSNGGAFSGKPTRAGVFRISVRVTDSRGSSDGTVFPMTVTGPPLSIVTTTLANATLGVPYSGSVQAAGGIPPYVFGVISGSLPVGLSLATDGTISGTPTALDPGTFTVQVTDAAIDPQGKVSRSFTISVTPNPPEITTTALTNGTIGFPYSGSVSAKGGVVPYTFSVASGSLPAGLSLASDGSITGTPTALGDSSVTIQVADKLKQTASKGFSLKIVSPPSITTNAPLSLLVVGTPSPLTLAATGGTLPFTWTVSSGSLPAGLSLDSGSGAITGTPSAAGPYGFSATVTDANKLTATKPFTGRVTTPVRITTASPLPAATVGTAYSAKIDATGGVMPYRFAADALPAGLSIDSSGLISGTPTSAIAGAFTVTVTDVDSLTASARLALPIILPPLSGVTIGGVTDTPPPAQQQNVTVTLTGPYPVPLVGTVVLTFVSDAVVPVDDPAIQFSSGGRTAAFTIPAGSTQGVFAPPNPAIQTGTVSGTITLTTTFQAGGGSVSCNCNQTRTLRVAKGVPVITSVRAVRGAGVITITIIGFSTSREMTQAGFQFTAAAGANVSTTSFTVPVAAFFTTWYTSTQSVPFGSQFTLTEPFTVSGDVNAVTNVSVTISNAQGASAAVSAAVQ